MSAETLWTVTYKIYRYTAGSVAGHFDSFTLTMKPTEYVLDGIERIWAHHDRTLSFRHACHHSACGACGLRVNGVEKLACITPIDAVTADGGSITVEPLRHFPIVSDLVVDMSLLHRRLDEIGFVAVQPIEAALAPPPAKPQTASRVPPEFVRLVDCLECGLCISACPITGSNPDYLGPAALAAIQHLLSAGGQTPSDLLQRADNAEGLWRCHAAYECTAVCPASVEPGERIMNLRQQAIGRRFNRLFRKGNRRKSS